MNWTFLAIEAVAACAFALVLREAWVRGVHQVSILLSAVLFGLAVEVFFVTQYSGYSYGRFLVEVPVGGGDSVPLWVALGWGTIIWTTMQASDRIGEHWAARAASDALLAVSLDVSLDPVAEALGWWRWDPPGQFLGVPYDNFVGWILIVGTFGLSTRAGFRYLPPGKHVWRDVLIPVASILPAALTVAGAQVVLDMLYPLVGQPSVFFVLTTMLLSVVTWASWGPRAESAPAWFLTGIPAAFHGLNTFLVLFSGIGVKLPELYLLVPLSTLTSLFGFRYPRWNCAAP